MMNRSRVQLAIEQITHHLERELMPFWLERAEDKVFGGYLTNYDAEGLPLANEEKYVVSQARMIWGCSALYQRYPDQKAWRDLAAQGVDFFIKYFWDKQADGWVWKTDRQGRALDRGKVTYGQSFAIYAFSQYGLATGDPRGLDYAERTFDLLQKYAADTFNGGYYENMEPDWSPSSAGYEAGDRKSLDIHMHLLEAFTALYQLTGKELHKRKLNEVIKLILTHMYDAQAGCGRNQFDLAFRPIPAISIRRTWNDDRGEGETVEQPMDTTSYGHNVELSWLLNRAAEVMGDGPDRFVLYMRALNDHALLYGLDNRMGGVYRDGPHEGEPLVRDKEWWQNCEALVGFLDACVRTGDARYFDAFEKCWTFCMKHMINGKIGEWYQLTDPSGNIIIGDLGNPWKVIYHTCRAMLEVKQRLEQLLCLAG